MPIPSANNATEATMEESAFIILQATDTLDQYTFEEEQRLNCKVNEFKLKVDETMCNICVSWIVRELEAQLKDFALESKSLKEYEAHVSSVIATYVEKFGRDDIVRANEHFELKTKDALLEMRELEAELVLLTKESAELQKEEEALIGTEATLCKEMNEFNLQVARKHEEILAITTHKHRMQIQMQELSSVNVYKDAFRIWHDGPFVTINGLKLGRLSDLHVEWIEINAAWGQTLLLLLTLAAKMNYTFKVYKLVPNGSVSSIVAVDDERNSYELYGSGELHIGRLLQNRRFDQAMVAFLFCVNEFSLFLQQSDASFQLPYAINKDQINATSLRYQFNQLESWTAACKYLLTNIKWILAFCTRSNKG